MESSLNNNEIKLTSIKQINLFLDSIGGRNFFLNFNNKYLIKSTNESEIMFYNNINNIPYSNKTNNFCPKFYGIIKRDSPEFLIIREYYFQCKEFFISYCIDNKIEGKDIYIGAEENADELLDAFINNQENELEKRDRQIKNSNNFIGKKEKINYDESLFTEIKEKINYIKNNSIERYKWILYWFIKYNYKFLLSDFVIIENIIVNMNEPSILDIKLGHALKISKKTRKPKEFKGISKMTGCRLMGILKKNSFINRYYCRLLSDNEYLMEFKHYFSNKELIESTINKINSFINDITLLLNKHGVKFKLKFSSILFAYDNSKESDKNIDIKIKLIDFYYINENIENIENIENNDDIVGSNILKCLKNLIDLLKKIKEEI